MLRPFLHLMAAAAVVASLIVGVGPLRAEIKDPTHTVLVSVAPHKFFVEQIAGDTVDVVLMVPAGASAHTYEPTPRQMIVASKGDIWFRIGESFEDKAIEALKSHHANLQVVDLREGLKLLYDHVCSHHKGSADLHFWLSPKMAKQQAETMAKALQSAYPQNTAIYQTNLEKFTKELDDLDQEIAAKLASLKNRTIMVSHPAYGYFARDYDLKQISIEFEGKDPTPNQLTKILNEARQLHIKKIYVQPQYSSKGAYLIAREIGALVIALDPYAENYLNSMREIANQFAN